MTEFFIVYLAIGASFGVHYFFSNRRQRYLFLWTLAACLFWIFYAPSLLHRFLFQKQSTNPNSSLDFIREKKVEELSNRLQKEFARFDVGLERPAFFDFRTALERYIGLTLALKESSETEETGEKELEIFRLANRSRKDLELAGRCLHRKNLLRLQTHQLRARQEFLQFVSALQKNHSESFNGNFATWQTFGRVLLQLTEALDDRKATDFVRQFLLAETQRYGEERVLTREKQETESWNRWKTESTFTMEQTTLKLRQTQD